MRTLRRRVQTAAGLSAGDWLRHAKLHQAGEALRRTRQPVKTISDQLGYASEASLHRAFRAATGMTPSAYRQAYSETAPLRGTPVPERPLRRDARRFRS